MRPICPYVACERGIGKRIKTFRHCQAGGSGISGHRNVTCSSYMRDLSRYFTPTVTCTFVFEDDSNGLVHLSIYNCKWHEKELLHPHAARNVIYQGGFDASEFQCIHQGL